ncbi:MAG: hypothetical protein Q9M28_07840, partial [Mariprofundaceae bacterium]|nr:hypothetical protein [Mariprofundaceae bacterium]
LSDAEFLNAWAEEVKAGLPETIGEFQLTKAWSRCAAGCQDTDNSPYLVLDFNAVSQQRNMPVAQLETTLKPNLLHAYCKSEAIKRNIKMGVFFSNRGKDADYNNFWVYPKDCL